MSLVLGLGLERVCPWPRPRNFFVSLTLASSLVSSTPALLLIIYTRAQSAARDWSRDSLQDSFNTPKFFTTMLLSNLVALGFFQTIFFVNSECYLINYATTSILQSSKFAFRRPLHKLYEMTFLFPYLSFYRPAVCTSKQRIATVLYFIFRPRYVH